MNQSRVSVEITSSLGRRLKVFVPAASLEELKKERVQKMAREVKKDGFRPGKVPTAIIEKLYGEEIWQEIVNNSVSSSLSDALIKEKLTPVANPTIEALKVEKGSPLEYTASFEVFPEVESPKLPVGVSFEKLSVDIEDADILEVLAQLRKQHTYWIEREGSAQLGDRITFDFFPEQGALQKNLQVSLEKDKLPLGLENFLDKNVGEEIDFSIPATAEGENSKGRIVIRKIEEGEIPPLDEQFAKLLGISDGNVETLKNEVHKHLVRESDRIIRENLSEQLINKLLENAHIPMLPETLIQSEYKHLEQEARRRLSQEFRKEYKENLPEQLQTQLKETAKTRITLELLFQNIIQENDIKLDKELFQKHLQQIASQYEGSANVLRELYKNKEMIANIQSQVMREQAINKLLEQVQFQEKKVKYLELKELKQGIKPEKQNLQ